MILNFTCRTYEMNKLIKKRLIFKLMEMEIRILFSVI